MTDPRTPGDVITRSVQRHQATLEASRALADEVATQRAQQASETSAPPTGEGV